MQADSKKVIRLLKTVRGQMDGIIKMVEENRYCVEISNQIMASRAILSRVNNEVLLAHFEQNDLTQKSLFELFLAALQRQVVHIVFYERFI